MPGTTPVYGFPYPEPTDLVADYPALGQQLAEDIEAVLPSASGLAQIAPTSIANSGGSASTSGNTTTFTGVSSISLNGVFSATYRNYRVLVNGTTSGEGTQWYLRLRASGTDATGSNYVYGLAYVNSAVVGFNTGGSNTSFASINYGFSAGTTNSQSSGLEFGTPFEATRTAITYASHGGGLNYGFVTHTLATSYDGFTLYPASGTITGTVSVYGYKK